MNNIYGYVLLLSLLCILFTGYVSIVKSYSISSATDEIKGIVGQLSPVLSKNESMALSNVLISLDGQFGARGLNSESIMNILGSQLHQDSNHSGILSQSLLFLSKYSVSNHTRSFESAYDIANGLDQINFHPPHVIVHNGVIDPTDIIQAISTVVYNTIGSNIINEKIQIIAHKVDGSLDPDVPSKVLYRIATSIGAHGGNISKSIDKIYKVVNSEYDLNQNQHITGPLIHSIRDLFIQRYYPNIFDNIINKIGFDVHGKDSINRNEIDRIIIKDVPIT